MISFIDFFYVFPELLLCFGIFVILLYSIFYGTSKQLGYPILAKNVALSSMFVLIILFLVCYSQPATNVSVFFEIYTISVYAQLVKLVVFVLGFCIIAASMQYVQMTRLNAFEYQLLLLLGIFGLISVISSNNLSLLYVALELQTLCFFILATAHRTTEISTEAGLKYFIFGAFSSGLLLFGLSLFYTCLGVSTLADMALILTQYIDTSITNTPTGLLYLGFILFLVGLLFKLYAVPFHIWVPDIYQGAPTNIVLFFATLPSFVLGAFLLRFTSTVTFSFFGIYNTIFCFVAFLSLVVGCFCAIYQRNIKRVLAYSSIMNVGLILFGFLASETAGFISIFFYLLVYILATLLFFSVLLGSYAKEKPALQYLRDLSFFAKEQPLLAAALSISVFSMAGFPPLAGFFSKLYIFSSFMLHGFYQYLLLGLAISSVSAIYYLRFSHIMYFTITTQFRLFKPVHTEVSYLIAAITLLILFFLITPKLILLYCTKLGFVLFV